MSVEAQNPDGSYSPIEPLGWQEEHNWLARLIFWLRRVEHCNDREGQRRTRPERRVRRRPLVCRRCPDEATHRALVNGRAVDFARAHGEADPDVLAILNLEPDEPAGETR